MPLPIFVAGLGLAASAISATGAVKGAQGAKKIIDAKTRVKEADARYAKAKVRLDDAENIATIQLNLLDSLKYEIHQGFSRFSNAFEKIQNRPTFEEIPADKFKMPKHTLLKVEEANYNTMGILGATMMLVGSAPLIAVGGLLLNAKGNASLEKAEEVEQEVERVVKTINKSVKFLKQLEHLSRNFELELATIYDTYITEVSKLEELVVTKNDYTEFSYEERLIVDNNIKLVAILFKLSNQALLLPTKNSKELPILLEYDVQDILSASIEAVAEI